MSVAAGVELHTYFLRLMLMVARLFAEVPNARISDAKGFEQFREQAVLLGLVGQMDPPRDEARDAVTECQGAGIRPVVVTGDQKATGLAIARALGIAGGGDRAVDGRELDGMHERDLRAGWLRLGFDLFGSVCFRPLVGAV